MEKKKKYSTDINVIAASIVKTTNEEPTEENPIKEENPATVKLGRFGGLIDGKARAEKFTPEERQNMETVNVSLKDKFPETERGLSLPGRARIKEALIDFETGNIKRFENIDSLLKELS